MAATAASPDHYAVLGLPRDASADDVRRAYKAAALRLHPDKLRPAGGDSGDGAFLRVRKAYEVLSDAGRRRGYDETGADDSDSDSGHGGGEGGVPAPFDLRAFLSAMLAAQRPSDRGRRRRTAGPQIAVLLSLEDVLRGCTKRVESTSLGECDRCLGTGGDECESCGGTGVGTTRVRRTLGLRIPPGAPDRSVVVVPGRGADPRPLEVCIVWDRRRMMQAGGCVLDRCDGVSVRLSDPETGDLEATVRLTLADVMCGYERTVDVHGDPSRVARLVVQGYAPPRERTFAGLGLDPRRDGTGSGDLVVRPVVEYPEEAALRRYAPVFERVFARVRPRGPEGKKARRRASRK